MKNQIKSHEFALYYDALPVKLIASDQLIITDADTIHRIERVLRLKKDEQCVLFNREWHAQMRIVDLRKKQIIGEIISVEQNEIYVPHITFFLPILKRDALSAAVYFLVEAGINTIQLIHGKNQQRAWGGQKEYERLERISIAAAEQSKNFAVPVIGEPISYEKALSDLPENSLRILANPDGAPFTNMMPKSMPTQIILTCGPEADLSVGEKDLMQRALFQSMRLTPTILRAETAAFCLSSLFRTVFSKSK